MYKRMWTALNHVTAAANVLLFGILLPNEGQIGLFETIEMRELIIACLPQLIAIAPYSEIAKREVQVIEVMLDYDRRISSGQQEKLDIEQIIGLVKNRTTNIEVISSEMYSSMATDGLPFQDLDGWEVLASLDDPSGLTIGDGFIGF